MSASELKPGDKITISGKVYCVKVEDGEAVLRPFDPYPQPDDVRATAERAAQEADDE